MDVGDDEPEFLEDPGPAAGIAEKDTLLFDALDPDRDRFLFLILDKNRDALPSFFSGLVLLNEPRAEEGPPETGAGVGSGVAFPDALFAFA
jgi:hypothetical protein